MVRYEADRGKLGLDISLALREDLRLALGVAAAGAAGARCWEGGA